MAWLCLIYYYGCNHWIFWADHRNFPLQSHVQVFLAPTTLISNSMTAAAVPDHLELHLTLPTFWGATSSPGVIRGSFGKTLLEILPTRGQTVSTHLTAKKDLLLLEVNKIYKNSALSGKSTMKKLFPGYLQLLLNRACLVCLSKDNQMRNLSFKWSYVLLNTGKENCSFQATAYVKNQ